jgi:type III secretory pathway component EscS
MGSAVKEVQALSLVSVADMVKSASPEQLRPHLASLVPALLESLSGMEARLVWLLTALAEQHLPHLLSLISVCPNRQLHAANVARALQRFRVAMRITPAA